MTATSRVQRILDAAAKYGWDVEDRNNNTWVVHPPNTDLLHPDGFVVYNSGANGARVVSQSDWKPVSQRQALFLIANRNHTAPTVEEVIEAVGEVVEEEDAEAVDIAELLRKIAEGNPNAIVVEGAGSLADLVGHIRSAIEERLDSMPEEERENMSEFAEGAMLASSTLADMVEQLAADGEKALAAAQAEHPGEAGVITSRSGAQAWLSLAMMTHDPYVIRRVFKDFDEEPSQAQFFGAARAFESVKRVWETLADSIYLLDTKGEDAVPIEDFFRDMRKHAQGIRETADEAFGKYVTVSDADLEGLLK